MTIKEVQALERSKGLSFTETEVFKNIDPRTFSLDYHTDKIESVFDFTGDEQVIDYQIMEEEQYNNSILANTSLHFTDFYEKNDKILVIKIRNEL